MSGFEAVRIPPGSFEPCSSRSVAAYQGSRIVARDYRRPHRRFRLPDPRSRSPSL